MRYARSACSSRARSPSSSAQWLPWPAVFALLGVLFLPSIGADALAPEPDPPGRQRRRARSARRSVSRSRTYFGRAQALTVAAFLVLYKFGDNVAPARRRTRS